MSGPGVGENFYFLFLSEIVTHLGVDIVLWTHPQTANRKRRRGVPAAQLNIHIPPNHHSILQNIYPCDCMTVLWLNDILTNGQRRTEENNDWKIIK